MKLTGITQTQVDEQKAEEHRLSEIAEMEGYLASTDWYAVRFAETGQIVPETVLEKRADARARISELRKQP
jgi:hypothetical protein